MTSAADEIDGAIAWYERINAPDADETTWSEFTVWLEADAKNREAFDRIEALHGELDTNAHALGRGAQVIRFPRRHGPRTGARRLAGAGVLAASLLIVVYFFMTGAGARTYATAVGETRSVTLADGTHIDLNTATSLAVAPDSRHVALARGEALFRVAKDAAHPFVVTVGNRAVRVVGTVFDIVRAGGAIAVTVSEGRVAVLSSAGAAGVSYLGPGDSLSCEEAGNCESIRRVDPADVMAWRRGYLVYRDAPLSRVVADLNRYFPAPVAVAGDAAAERFTGVLRIDTQEAMLSRLAALVRLTITHRPDGRIDLRRAPAKP